MSTELPLSVIGVLALAIACDARRPPTATAKQAKESPAMAATLPNCTEWRKVLTRALSHTEADREALTTQAHSEHSPALGALARVLLEEWTPSPESADDEQPRQVIPPPPLDLSRISNPNGLSLPFVVVQGTVGVEGCPLAPTVVRSSGSSEVDALCIEAFVNTRYRPARVGGKFVEGKATQVCHVNVR